MKGLSRLFDEAGFLQGLVGSVLVDRFERLGGELDGDEAVEFWNPNATLLEIDIEHTEIRGRDVLTNTSTLLGETTAMNHPTFERANSGNFTFSGHTIEASGGGVVCVLVF